MRRDQDSLNPRTQADVMLLAHEDLTARNSHPYWYARIIGLFHVYVTCAGDSRGEQRIDFLWVRWLGRDI